MTMISTKKRRGRALVAAFLAISVSGCGVVYKPQELTKSVFKYGYKGDLDVAIEVVPLGFMVARSANADGYTPRSLPAALADAPQSPGISIQERLAASGLNQVNAPATFENPTGFPPYNGASEVLPVIPRTDTYTPLPSLDLAQNPLTSGTQGSSSIALPGDATGSITPLDELTLRRESQYRPLPDATPPPYRIGSGDVISLQSQARSQPALSGSSGSGDDSITGTRDLLVQDNGNIFIPIVGPIRVAGLTLSEARAQISDALTDNQIGLDAGIQVTEFGSKRVAVSGISGNQLIPITVRPTTLGEAIALSGGLGQNPDNIIVRVLREGEIYEMSGDDVASSSDLATRVLLDGDIVSIGPAYNLELALTYFDEQLRLRALERQRLTDALSRRSEERAVQSFENQQLQLQIELENFRLQADRLRQEAEIARITARRDTDRLNEDARIANLVARQGYLDQLRALEQSNRDALNALRAEKRTVALANQAERSRARAELRALLEFELREVDMKTAANQRAQALFTQRLALGAVERDYVTIAGETVQQSVVTLPFESQLTLARALYEETRGPNLLSADTSEIYVFRVHNDQSANGRLIAYHLDASNPAALAVASVFEMRPNDVVYVNPQPITTWNRVLTQILPSTGLLQTVTSTAFQ